MASAGGGLKHAATEPAHLDNRRERRGRGAAGRAAALRRAPSDSDCSGETASLSADSADRVRSTLPPPRQTKSRRRRGSEWEVLEGLKDGQRFERRPEVFNGYLHKKRKWPLKGWHKRFFVVDGGILVYARSPTDVARGRLHGSVDVGLSVISAKARRRRIDIDADEFIYHLRAKTPDVFRTWLNVLKAHRLYRQHLLTFGARESVPKIHAPLDDLPPTDASSLSMLTSFVSDSLRRDSINDDLKVIKPPSLISPPDSYPFPLNEDTIDINKNLVQCKDNKYVTYKNQVKDWKVIHNNDNVTYKNQVDVCKITPKDDLVTYKSSVKDCFITNKANHATYEIPNKVFNVTYKYPDKDDHGTYRNQIKDWDIRVTHKNDHVTSKNPVKNWDVTHKRDHITYKNTVNDWDKPHIVDYINHKNFVKDWDIIHKNYNGTTKNLVKDWDAAFKGNRVTAKYKDSVKNWDVSNKDDNVTYKKPIKEWDVTLIDSNFISENPVKDWHIDPVKQDLELLPDFDLPLSFEALDDSKIKSTERIWNHSLCSMKCLQALYKEEIQKFQNMRKFALVSHITEKEQAQLSMILDDEPQLSIYGVESNLFKNDEISDITIPPVIPTFSEILTPNKSKSIDKRKTIHVPPLFKTAEKKTFFLFSHKKKTRSQILKKSKKATNLSKYKNVMPEPPLEKPLRRVMIRRNKIRASKNFGKKADCAVQTANLMLIETKSQHTMPSTELDHTAENLAKSFVEMYSLSFQRARFEQCVTQMIRNLYDDNKPDSSVSPLIIVFRNLLDYWLSTNHPNNIQCNLKENMKNKTTFFQSAETQFESTATKDAAVFTIENLNAQKSGANQTPTKWKGLMDEEPKSSFFKERRIEEIEKLVKNTMYETECDGTSYKENRITKNINETVDSVYSTKQIFKNASKISVPENAQEFEKCNTATEYKKIQEEIRSFITETSIPPTIVKAYLQMLKDDIKDSSNISEELKEQNYFQNNVPNVKGETLQKKESLAMLINKGIDKTKATKNKGDESTQDSSQTVIKELFSRIANYFNSSESINKYTKHQHIQPDDIEVERSIEGSHITLHGKDKEDNSLVLDLTKYSLDNISVLSDARGEISITIKLKEPLTIGRSIKQNKLSIKFSENKPKPTKHIIEQNSGDSRCSSASFRRALNSRISFRNPYIDLGPLPLVNKMQWMTVSDTSILTYKAYRKLYKTKNFNKITRGNELKRGFNTHDEPKTCYILSDLKKRGYRLINRKDVTKEYKGVSVKPSELAIELSNPDSKLIVNRNKSGSNQVYDEFEVINLQPKELTIKLSKSCSKQDNTANNNSKSKTIIDENFILSLLENLTLLSKHVPNFYKDINGLYVKLKKRHDKKTHKESSLGLLGEIYNNDQVTDGVKTLVNADVRSSKVPKVNRIHNSVNEKLKEVQADPKKVVSEATDFNVPINNEAQTEFLEIIEEKSYDNTHCSKNIATSMSVTDLNHPLDSNNIKENRLKKIAVKRTNETSEIDDSKLEKDEEFDLSEVLRNLFNMSTSDVNFNFVFDENKKCYKSVPTRLNKTKCIAKNHVQISKTRKTVARKKSRNKDEKLNNIEKYIIIEPQKISTSEKNYETLLLPLSMMQNDKNLKPMLDKTVIDTFIQDESINLDKDLNVCFNLTEKISRSVPCLSSLDNGLISPSAPLRAQAGFVAGTPGGRLANWIVESGGPLENASRELGQAQLSVQQLQRLLDSLELQHHHHDTDQVSLEGASPNVKKDRRKFGLRKKKSHSKCASVDLAPPIDPSNSHMALSALTAPPSPGGASSAPNSAASLPIACAATRPMSLPGAETLGGGTAPSFGPLAPLTPDHQLREDFSVLAKDLVATLNTVLATLVCERGRLRSAMEAAETGTPGGAVVAALRTNLTTALQQNSELRSRLSRIHDASDLAEISSVNNTDPAVRPFQQSLSFSSSCVSASEFFDAEEHGSPPNILPADETGVIELDGDSSSEAGSLSSEEGSASSDNSDGALLSAEPVSLTVSSNGVSLEPPSGWSRRTTLPCPRPTPGGPSLWNLLYKNIGKDLSQVSMPVTINEPLNMLQRLCEELEYSELLDAAADCPNGLERMALIAAFAVSAYAASAHRAASKPFNPLLAETYECVRGDKGFKFLAEQVSHHPPISACHAESTRWVFWQEARIKTKFWGKSMEFQPAGRVHVRLISTGDHYSWNKVTTCVHNLFGGQRWVDQYGDMLITNHGNDITAKLNFIKASSWSSSRHEVRGWVSDGLGGRLRLQGRWSEALYAGEPPAARCLWRPGAMPPEHELYYGFTRFAMELNEMEPGLRELLPHTDTRLRPDQRALEQGDVEAAERYKLQLEQAQRDRRSQQDLHMPAWFRKAYEDGDEMWVFTGEYWTARDSGFAHLRAPAIW